MVSKGIEQQPARGGRAGEGAGLFTYSSPKREALLDAIAG